jgi:serine protease AprX
MPEKPRSKKLPAKNNKKNVVAKKAEPVSAGNIPAATTPAATTPVAATPPSTPAVHDWPKLEVFSEGQLAIARKTVTNQYGAVFASKASDRLCQALSTVSLFALESVGPSPRPVILEFSVAAVKPDDVQKRAAMIAGTESINSQVLLRTARRHAMRDQFHIQVAPITANLEKRSQSVFPAGPQALVSPTTPSSVVEVCWLNGTLRTFVDPRGLRDVAAESSLAQLDLPRPLRAEIDGTAPRVGAPQFRKKFNLTGEHITVAVIDTEVDVSHPALAGRVMQKVNYTKERWGSPNPHGTCVAGIIAATDTTFAGIGPQVTIANYKVLATDASLNSDDFGGALAIQQALEDGAQIANCSWGSGPAGDGTGREAVACNNAWNLGLILVKSAGNGGPDSSTLTTPADADGIIVVGATDRAGTAVQDYSSRGPAGAKPRPHLVAPGGSDFDPMHSCQVGGGFGSIGAGTSFAAPHISGLAALLLAQTPGLSPNDLRDKLLSLCTPLPGVDSNTQGKGFVSLISLTT